MLSILYANRDKLMSEHNLVRNHYIHFEERFDWDWLNEDWVRRELHDVEGFPMDKEPKQVLFDRGITWKQLCGGTKTLLLMRHMDGLFDLARMGPNCYKYMMEISDIKDVRVGIDRLYVGLDDSVIGGRSILVENSGVVVHDGLSLYEEVYAALCKE